MKQRLFDKRIKGTFRVPFLLYTELNVFYNIIPNYIDWNLGMIKRSTSSITPTIPILIYYNTVTEYINPEYKTIQVRTPIPIISTD